MMFINSLSPLLNNNFIVHDVHQQPLTVTKQQLNCSLCSSTASHRYQTTTLLFMMFINSLSPLPNNNFIAYDVHQQHLDFTKQQPYFSRCSSTAFHRYKTTTLFFTMSINSFSPLLNNNFIVHDVHQQTLTVTKQQLYCS